MLLEDKLNSNASLLDEVDEYLENKEIEKEQAEVEARVKRKEQTLFTDLVFEAFDREQFRKSRA